MKSTDLHSRESIELRVADPEQPWFPEHETNFQFRTALLSQRRHRRYYLCEGKGGSGRPGRVGHGSSTKTDPTYYRVEYAIVWISSCSFVDVFHLKGDAPSFTKTNFQGF
jgi:hypothetical protein